MADRVKWLDDPDRRDLDAAYDYLELVLMPVQAERVVSAFEDVESTVKRPQDILRAAQLPLLSVDDPDVARVLVRVRQGRRLSPVLLARSPVLGRVLVADGYGRVCASFHVDKAAGVPARLI